MHPESYAQMHRLLQRYGSDNANVLDVGSIDVNGAFRPLVEKRAWRYTGLDLVAGKNVDVVAEDAYRYPFDDGAFDIVLSGSTMEHVEAIWLWIPELVRVLRPGGMLAIITHTRWELHPYPVDCWRIMPDGMKYLFDLTGALERIEIQMYDANDIFGLAWKKENQ